MVNKMLLQEFHAAEKSSDLLLTAMKRGLCWMWPESWTSVFLVDMSIFFNERLVIIYHFTILRFLVSNEEEKRSTQRQNRSQVVPRQNKNVRISRILLAGMLIWMKFTQKLLETILKHNNLIKFQMN